VAAVGAKLEVLLELEYLETSMVVVVVGLLLQIVREAEQAVLGRKA
jgi:hypothetical protein